MTSTGVIAAAVTAGVATGACFAAEVFAIAGDVMTLGHFTFAISAGTFGSFGVHSEEI